MHQKALTLALALLAAPAALAASPYSDDITDLSIRQARTWSYPGSAFTVRQTLRPGTNYGRYLVSYQSEGLRIDGLLTVPNGSPPRGGWPAVAFIHGYVPPSVYRTTERYVAYQDAFARSGLVTFKPDLRGHGSSQGEASGAYYSAGYTNDVLNAVGSLRRDPRVNGKRLGIWGHSMGGFLALRAMTVDPQIKAGVIFAGVVGDYYQLAYEWPHDVPVTISAAVRQRRIDAVNRYGTPKDNPQFWRKLSANSYLGDLGGPLQLHIGTADKEVPAEFHTRLAQRLRDIGHPVASYVYPNDDHNLSRNLDTALERSVAWFKRYL